MVLIPTILCGGAGSRLWPVSRELHPKPFIRLADNQSLLQKAFLRGAELPDVKEIVTVTNRELLFKTKDEFGEINSNELITSYILEPFGRNTAAAIVAAAIQVKKNYGDDAVLLILAADHLIADHAAFKDAVEQATQLAREGKIVTFGMHADSPATGYGYIQAEGNNVLRFVEKPSLEKAQEYLASGDYYWNSGMFCFTAGSLLQEMDRHSPDILAATTTCMHNSKVISSFSVTQVELDATTFAQVPDLSIDYALMEKSKKVAVVPANIGWSDIGSWNEMANLVAPDKKGNRIHGHALVHETNDCYIHSEHRLVGVVGVDNLVVIDTPDALLVADKSRSQEVKHIYKQLKDLNHDAHKLHRTVFRPWGTYTVLEEGDGFKIKRIVVKPGASLSLQMHRHRSEHWVVVNGVAKVTNGDRLITIKTNESTYIPAGNKHRLENTTDTPVVMIEVQTGAYVGEDDIIRFQDVYGRVEEVV